jgi:ParB/RepB/Spo0J family partition protein
MTTSHTAQIDLRAIIEPGHQLRQSINAEQLGELADSIAAEGLLQPIGLRGPSTDGRYEIVWGHRRFLAVSLLRWNTIEARIFPPDYDPLLAAVAENEMRVDLTPMEQAHAVKKMLDAGYPEAGIARTFRHSAQWVRERIELLTLPTDLQTAVHDRRLTIAAARILGDVDHDDYRAALVAEAQRTGASATTIDVWRAHYLADRDRIIRNRETVAEISSRREAWKIMVPCELCELDFEYANTVSVRVCVPCRNELDQAVRDVAQAHPPTNGNRAQ